MELATIQGKGIKAGVIEIPADATIRPQDDAIWDGIFVETRDGIQLELIAVDTIVAMGDSREGATSFEDESRIGCGATDADGRRYAGKVLAREKTDAGWVWACATRYDGKWCGDLRTYRKATDLRCDTVSGAGVCLDEGQIARARAICESLQPR